MVNSRHMYSQSHTCTTTNMGAASHNNGNEDIILLLNNAVEEGITNALAKIELKHLEWSQKYNCIIESLQRIKNNFTSPFVKEEYWNIGNALGEFQRLEDERVNDVTNGLLTDLLQEIVSGCNLAKTLDFYFTLCKNELTKCKENEIILLDKIEDLTNPELADMAAGTTIGVSIKLPSIPILSIIGKMNIYIAWYYLTYCKGYNPLAVIDPQKYLYIKSSVNEMGTLENALAKLEEEENKLHN